MTKSPDVLELDWSVKRVHKKIGDSYSIDHHIYTYDNSRYKIIESPDVSNTYLLCDIATGINLVMFSNTSKPEIVYNETTFSVKICEND